MQDLMIRTDKVLSNKYSI